MEPLREPIEGSNVQLVMCASTDPPPPEEAARLRDSLRRLFPPASTPVILLLLAWSQRRQAWRVRSAKQQVADVAFVDRSADVADALTGAGHAVAVSPNPMDSPPDGVRLPLRR